MDVFSYMLRKSIKILSVNIGPCTGVIGPCATLGSTMAGLLLVSSLRSRRNPTKEEVLSRLGLGCGNIGKSFLPTFFSSSFIMIILKPGTVVSHLASIVLINVVWHVNSSPDWSLCGEVITGASFSAVMFLHLLILIKILTCFLSLLNF